MKQSLTVGGWEEYEHTVSQQEQLSRGLFRLRVLPCRGIRHFTGCSGSAFWYCTRIIMGCLVEEPNLGNVWVPVTRQRLGWGANTGQAECTSSYWRDGCMLHTDFPLPDLHFDQPESNRIRLLVLVLFVEVLSVHLCWPPWPYTWILTSIRLPSLTFWQ